MRHSTACHLLEAGSRYYDNQKHTWTCICTDNTDLCRNVADSVDRKLKEWNDTWFSGNAEVKEVKKVYLDS